MHRLPPQATSKFNRNLQIAVNNNAISALIMLIRAGKNAIAAAGGTHVPAGANFIARKTRYLTLNCNTLQTSPKLNAYIERALLNRERGADCSAKTKRIRDRDTLC